MKSFIKEYVCDKCNTIFEDKLSEGFVKNVAPTCPNCGSKEIKERKTIALNKKM